jgi:uncharacterized protein
VILVDANRLLYAHVDTFPQHEAARSWLDERLSGAARVGLPWPSLLAFLRLVSNPRVFARPESPADAWVHVEEWLQCPRVWVPQPTERHSALLARFSTRRTRARIWSPMPISRLSPWSMA